MTDILRGREYHSGLQSAFLGIAPADTAVDFLRALTNIAQPVAALRAGLDSLAIVGDLQAPV